MSGHNDSFLRLLCSFNRFTAFKKNRKPQPKDAMNEAFLSGKAALVGATMLSHPSPGATISLTSDASDRDVKLSWNSTSTIHGNFLLSSASNFVHQNRKTAHLTKELLGLYLVPHFRFFLDVLSQYSRITIL